VPVQDVREERTITQCSELIDFVDQASVMKTYSSVQYLYRMVETVIANYYDQLEYNRMASHEHELFVIESSPCMF
jgi:hypothetical protein